MSINESNSPDCHRSSYDLEMGSVGDRVKHARKTKGLSQQQLCAAIGMKQPTLSALETNVSKDTVFLPEIERETGFRAQWLKTGRGPQRVTDVQANNVTDGPDIKGTVPLISWVQAGAWSDVQDPYLVGDAEAWVQCPGSHGPRTYCLRVDGESMLNPTGRISYAPGDIIFTGTPSGVGPVQPGDKLHAAIERVGELSLQVYKPS